MARSAGMDNISGRALSVRLPDDLAGEIDVIARVEGVSVSETVRAALHSFVSTRRSDEDFKERLRQRIEKDRQVLERFGGLLRVPHRGRFALRTHSG